MGVSTRNEDKMEGSVFRKNEREFASQDEGAVEAVKREKGPMER